MNSHHGVDIKQEEVVAFAIKTNGRKKCCAVPPKTKKGVIKRITTHRITVTFRNFIVPYPPKSPPHSHPAPSFFRVFYTNFKKLTLSTEILCIGLSTNLF
jgi:hypothetical protein